jgi:cell division protein FtsI/penicillin-binding protein 2
MAPRIARRTTRPPAARRLAAALCLGLVVTALPGCGLFGGGAQEPLAALVKGWQKGQLAGLTLLTTDGEPLAGQTAQDRLKEIEGDLSDRRPDLALGKVKENGDNASAPVDVTWQVADGATWKYRTTVSARRGDDGWTAFCGPGTVHPDLRTGDKLTVRRDQPQRGAILDGSGAPIVTARPVVTVGLQPGEVKDVPGTVAQLAALFKAIGVDVDLAGLPGRLSTAKPDAFVEVVTLRREAYEQIRAQIRALPGTVFNEASLPLAPTRVFARALLGGVGEVTKEIMDKNPGKYRIGDVVGQGGLQQRYEDVLRGAPGVLVVVAGKEPGQDRKLFSNAARDGAPVKTTLDVRVQNAADTALAGVAQRASVVAVRISDGAVVAVANGPGGGQLNLGFTAQVPPGSTFKMVSALNLLDSGAVTRDTAVACPRTFDVGGRSFKNSENFELGTVPFHVDFARSCNTAFASLAPKLGWPQGLATTGQSLGLGVPWDLGADVYSGKVSTGASLTEQAAASFGQGTTQVSPVAMAGAAAAVARGQWKQPRLVTEPAPAKPAPDGPALKPESLNQLRGMMREVVTDGTAAGVRGLPGEPVYGKTGTAEYDNDPTHTHAWFAGWRGDLAFAVFVENGGSSSDTAVPITAKFFSTLG